MVDEKQSIEDRLKELREEAKIGIELEGETLENDEMIQQTRKKFKRLQKRV